jgi:hypothetical protein
MDWAAAQLQVKAPSDWYKVSIKVTNMQPNLTIKELTKLGATPLLKKYKNSTPLLLSSVYPEHEWLPWKFGQLPNNFWENVNNKKLWLEWVSKQLKIKEISDWYKVSQQVTVACYYPKKLGLC